MPVFGGNNCLTDVKVVLKGSYFIHNYKRKDVSSLEKKNPEMQIIGPSKSKFSRRQEYGVGKMYDRKLDEVCRII